VNLISILTLGIKLRQCLHFFYLSVCLTCEKVLVSGLCLVLLERYPYVFLYMHSIVRLLVLCSSEVCLPFFQLCFHIFVALVEFAFAICQWGPCLFSLYYSLAVTHILFPGGYFAGIS